MKQSERARQQAETQSQQVDQAHVPDAKKDANGNWPAGQPARSNDAGFDRSHQGAPRADDRSQYTGQSAYGGLEGGTANENKEHQDTEHRRSSAGQRGEFGEGSFGGEPGANQRGGMSSYGNSSGSRYAIDNEEGTTARTKDDSLSSKGAAQGAAPVSTDIGQYAGNYDDSTNSDTPVDSPASRAKVSVGHVAASKSDDDRLREGIQARLMEHPHLDLHDVSVSVQGGRVLLAGSVPERRMKRAIQDTADNVSGVMEIENRIEVKRREDAVSTFASGYTAGQAYAAAGDVASDPARTAATSFGVATAKTAAEKPSDGAKKHGKS